MKAPQQPTPAAAKNNARQSFLQRKPASADAAERPFISRKCCNDIQPKLTVNRPGDAYEQEADRMADRVIRMPMAAPAAPPMISRMHAGAPVQRKCSACAAEEKLDSPHTSEEVVQRQAASSDPTHASDAVAQRLIQRKGRGHALPPALHDHMGQAFQADFSDVRLHTDAEAAQMSDDLNAQAFTHGSDIYFNAGKYQPGTAAGRGLLGHELTHTVQQGGGVIKMKTDSSRIQREPEEEIYDPEWEYLNDSFWEMMIEIGLIDQKIPTVTRRDLNGEIFQAFAKIGDPGEKTEEELEPFHKTLSDFEEKARTLYYDAHDELGWLLDLYEAEVKRLEVLVHEPASVEALDILNTQYYETMRRVDLAEHYLVPEDLLGLKYMLENNKHLENAAWRVYWNRHKGKDLGNQDGIDVPWHDIGYISGVAGHTMTSEAALREVYKQGARAITNTALKDVAKGIPDDWVAQWAVRARNDFKTVIRSRGSSIVRGLAEARNITKYGDKIGPSYEQLIKEGKTPKDIIGSAGRASEKVNKVASKLKVGGKLLIYLDFAIVTWDVFSAPTLGKKIRAAAGGVAGIAGAYGGGVAGMKAGGSVGSFFGPWGTAIGGFLGMVGGALVGGFVGRKVGEGVYDLVDELVNPGSDWDEFCEEVDAAEDAYMASQIQK